MLEKWTWIQHLWDSPCLGKFLCSPCLKSGQMGLIHISYLCGKKCQTRYIFIFWRNFWWDIHCTVFYHFSTRLWTCFWESKLSSFDLSCIMRINYYRAIYTFTLTNFTNFISSLCTEMSRPKCPMTQTARPNWPDRIGQTKTAQIEMAQTVRAQTETARTKSRVPVKLFECSGMLLYAEKRHQLMGNVWRKVQNF